MKLLTKLSALTAGRRLAVKNAPTVHKGIDTIASAVKGRVGHQHRGKVDTGASLAKRALTGTDQPHPEPQRT